MSDVLAILLSTNKELTKRLRKGKLFYVLFISVICSFLLSFGALFMLKHESKSEYQVLFNLLSYTVVVFDIGLICMKFSNKALIEPNHLTFYPIGKWRKFKFYTILLLTDYKSFLYVIAIAISTLFFLQYSLYLSAIISINFWVLLLMVILSWTLVIYKIGGNLLNQYRNNISKITIWLGFSLIGINLFNVSIITKIPITSYLGNGLYGLLIADLNLVLVNVLLLVASLILALIFFQFSRSNYF